MNGETFLSVIEGEREDTVPLYLFDITLGMEAAGYRTDEIFAGGFDGERSARSLLALNRLLGTDAVNGSVSWFDTRILGNEVAFPPDGIPYIVSHVLADPGRIDELDTSSVPDSELDELALSNALVREGTDAALVHHVPSPLGAACSLRGIEAILMDMLIEPGFVERILEFTSELTRTVAGYVSSEVPPDMFMISGAYDNLDLAGPDCLRRFSTPYLERSVSELGSSGLLVCFHPHGPLSSRSAEPLLREYSDMGIRCLYYGENVDPLALHDMVPGMSLMGGVDTFTTIVLGDRERVIADTLRCLDMTEGMSYCFSCSCSVDRGLPMENIMTMCRTVKGRSPMS